jgi:hypothetical protein
MPAQCDRKSSGLTSVSKRFRHAGSSSGSKMKGRIARVLSAIGAASNHFSRNSPKLFTSLMRPLLALLLDGGRHALGDRRPCVDALLPGVSQGQSIGTILAQVQGFAPPIQMVVHSKGHRALRRDMDIHTVAIRDLVVFFLWFQRSKRCISEKYASTKTTVTRFWQANMTKRNAISKRWYPKKYCHRPIHP